MKSVRKKLYRIAAAVMFIAILVQNTAFAEETAENTATNSTALNLSTPSAVLMEASTCTILFEKNPDEMRSPASITKIMTLLLTFEAIEKNRIRLEDEVLTSAYAKSMGGSQVYLDEGEVQTVDTLIKCITVASGNDASVALAEYVAGSESEFVNMMNEKAAQLGMSNTHFMDCCGLSSDSAHHTTARDVAIMSRELVTKYPQVYEYTQIWMEDITHVTSRGTETFTLASTNKLLKQYQWTTGLKTGSTSVAKYCFSATASKNGIDLIAVIMGAPDPKVRFAEAQILLEYGFAVTRLYVDENKQALGDIPVTGGRAERLAVEPKDSFRYLDTTGADFNKIEKMYQFADRVTAPVEKGAEVGYIRYSLEGRELGRMPIIAAEPVEKALYMDYLKRILVKYLV